MSYVDSFMMNDIGIEALHPQLAMARRYSEDASGEHAEDGGVFFHQAEGVDGLETMLDRFTGWELLEPF